MTIVEKTVGVNKNINEVFDVLFQNNIGIFSEHMHIIEYEKCQWEVKNKLKQRKSVLYLYIPCIPDEAVSYLNENDKYLRIQIKNKVITDTPTHQKIKSKIKILNVNPFFKTLINDLNIVSIKNTTVLDAKSADKTNVKILIKINVNIPKTKKLNEFISDLCNKLMDSAVSLIS